jgi:phosphatidyl-myo-inositol dimannoside synthase
MVTRRTLLVTNDFPPRRGGIQSFVHGLARRQPRDSIVVYTSNYPGAADFDAEQPFPVIRHSTGLLLPTPAVGARARQLVRDHGCTAAWFGAAAPLGLLAGALRGAGVEQIVATTHGHEVGWAMLPGARAALRRIARECDVVTYLGEYTRSRLDAALGSRTDLRRLTPWVDASRFRSDGRGRLVRERYRLADRPVIGCVSRLVARKGQDALIRSLPAIQARVPGTMLLIVGTGKYESTLRRLADRCGVGADVVFTGAVAEDDLPAHYQAADVFAMPCRTRRAGLDVEGLGIVFLEASAAGLPVVAGDSGGAPDAVLAGRSGFVVDGRDEPAIVDRIVALLMDEPLRHRFGAAGLAWVQRDWQWDTLAESLRAMLDE